MKKNHDPKRQDSPAPQAHLSLRAYVTSVCFERILETAFDQLAREHGEEALAEDVFISTAAQIARAQYAFTEGECASLERFVRGVLANDAPAVRETLQTTNIAFD